MNVMNRLRPVSLAAICFAVLSISSVSAQDLFQRDSDKEKKSAAETSQTEQTTKITASDTTTANTAGKGNFVAGDEGWVKVEGSSANATFQLPKEPKYKTISFSPIAGLDPITTHMYISVINPQQSVVVSWHDLHEEPVGNPQIKDTLDGAVKGNVARVVGKLDEIKAVKVSGYPGREFNYSFSMKVSDTEEKILKAKSRIILVGQRQFQIQMITTEDAVDKATAERAFEALKLGDGQG